VVYYRLVALFFLLLFYGCQDSSVERSFYYWKTGFTLSPGDEAYLSRLKVHKLYIRLFDVDWDGTLGAAVPKGKISFNSQPPEGINVVPTVYIVNKAIHETSPGTIQALALKILKLVQATVSASNLKFTELQIDCDWTELTRDKYFQLLALLRKELEKNHQSLSCTIRLHQVKYAQTTGIPPVNRGMLMYYNMGKIGSLASQNSIFNKSDAAKYVAYAHRYPLPLDVALPSFSWGIHFRENKVLELIDQLQLNDFKNNINFIQTGNNLFRASSSFFFKGFYFIKNDLVKIEEVGPNLCYEAAKQVSKELLKKPNTVVIFHFEPQTLQQYEEKDVEKIFDTFH
jgi:hypothetical protein